MVQPMESGADAREMCVKLRSNWRCDSSLFFVLAVCMIVSTIALIALPVERQELVLREGLDGHRLRQLDVRLDARERVECRGHLEDRLLRAAVDSARDERVMPLERSEHRERIRGDGLERVNDIDGELECV